MIPIRPVLALIACAGLTAAQAQVSTYDPTTDVVTIPSVSVGAATFTGVTLKNRGNFVFDLTGFADQPKVAFPGVAAYDVTSGLLFLPAVKVGNATFLDVQLKDGGNFVFTLTSATALPQSVSDEVDALARAIEAQTAGKLWRNGAERLALTDSCWASNGRTRANYIADYDANLAAYLQRDASLIDRKIQNIQVLALRNLTNPDGSARREIDVQWDTAYKDGSVSRGEINTLISGSSAGTPRCTTPQTGAALRALGNQQLVAANARANNLREERYALSGGAALSPPVRYRREVEWAITDPMGNSTYVIVTGPGPSNTTAGVTYPFSMKFLSPRLLRSAPELVGKAQNFINWLDDDTFRNCFLSSGAVPVVQLVDCTLGGSSTSWGVGFTSTPDAAADQTFAAQGFVAGGVYRFDVYNDDGWRTVNGHAGKKPIATYYDTLDRLPYTFAQMADRYPVINLGGTTPAQVAANAVSATPAPLTTLSWTRPVTQSDGRVLSLNQVWEFHQGPRLGNASGVFNPAYRTLNRAYPGPTATSTAAFPVTPPVPGQNGKTYTEYLLFYSEPGSANSIRSRILFQ